MANSDNAREDGKTVAIICYFTFIGWVIGFLLNSNRKTSLGAWHLRQTLGLMVLILAVMVLSYPLSMMPGPGGIINLALNVGLLVLWLCGLYFAANGREKPLPVVGGLFQKWFAGLGV